MTGSAGTAWEHIGPEPWRVTALRDYDGPPPIPLEAIREGLRELGSLDGWAIAYGAYFGSFAGSDRWIPITYAEHPEYGRWQWLPVLPDGHKGHG